MEPPTVAAPSAVERLASALAWLFPEPCLGCGAALEGRRAPLLLCPACASRLRPQPSSACRGCGRPLPPSAMPAICGGCREGPPPWLALSAAFLYLPPLTAVVRALKFRSGDFLASPLAVMLAARCEPYGAAMVTSVPLAWPRLLVRGYDQAEALARPLAAALGLPFRRLLARRHRRPQTGLARVERARNVRGTFRLGREPVRGTTVLLVDDVMTTGATLGDAAAALRRGGATVVAAVLARTPRPDWGDPSAHPPPAPPRDPPPPCPARPRGSRGGPRSEPRHRV